MRRAILWFRNDLRLHDNEALNEACLSADEVLPVYVFDPRVFEGKTRFGFPKTGKYRCKFILESVADLKNNLSTRLGLDLIIRIGEPEQEIFQLANQIKSNWVFCNRERTDEEVLVQDSLEKELWTIGQEMRYSRGKMLVYTSDLPFPVTHTPDAFAQYRKEIDPFVRVREPLEVPQKIERVSVKVDPGKMPGINDFGWDVWDEDSRASVSFTGGESSGVERLEKYIWESGELDKFHETRKALKGPFHASHFSPWLAQGCLSPKKIYSVLMEYENEHGYSESSRDLKWSLYLRDYHRLIAKKYGNLIFQQTGILKTPNSSADHSKSIFSSWANGLTGFPIVDAIMRELNATGFTSNRGRLISSSFFVNELKQNWLPGSEYFESMLIDYDPASNYGNWMQIAGIGADAKAERTFNLQNQTRQHDPKGEYIFSWVPELKPLKDLNFYEPFAIDEQMLTNLSFTLGKNYPMPIIKPSY